MTTTEQTEDEFTKKRRLDTLAKEAADYVARGAALYDEMRKMGLNPPAILKEVSKHIPEMQTERTREVFPGLGFSIEALRLAVTGGSVEEKNELLASMRDLTGIKVTVRDQDGYVVDDPTPQAIRDAVARESDPPPPSWVTIQRLFKEHPSPLPDQAPAIECGVMLRGVPITLLGALSETPEGGLRLLSPDPHQERPIRPGTQVKMIEQFFDYEDVLVVAVQRNVTVDAPRIIRS